MHQLVFFPTPKPEKKAQKPSQKCISTAFTRVKIPDPPLKPAPYGNCSCEKSIQFPELAAYYYGSCGYRVDTTWFACGSMKKGGKAS